MSKEIPVVFTVFVERQVKGQLQSHRFRGRKWCPRAPTAAHPAGVGLGVGK